MERYEQEHREALRKLAPECMVLLKSDGSFPLEGPQPVALYGAGARHTVKGGTGSGDVNTRSFRTVEEGLEKAGCTITTKAWLDGYAAARQKAKRAADKAILDQIAREGLSEVLWGLGNTMPDFDYSLPMDGAGECAVYVLSRISGEGADRSTAPGDFALRPREIREILTLNRRYRRFLLVLNTAGVVDLSPVTGEVRNILLLGQLGSVTGDAFADVLLGKAYPSGKLTATWAPWEDYCQEGDFGRMDDTRYREGVYVGYRYFDSVGKAPLFPFGYGSGYTAFSIQGQEVRLQGRQAVVTAAVKNTGSRPGKEVVQLYVGKPAGKLDQPYQELAAFAKTPELQPGQTATLALAFDLTQIASYDSETAASVLEKGLYRLYLGNSSRDTALVGALRLDRTVTVRPLAHAGGKPDFVDWKPADSGITLQLPPLPQGIPVLAVDAAQLELPGAPRAEDTAALALVRNFRDEMLADLCIGGYEDGKDSQEIVGNAGRKVLGSAGESCGRYAGLGVPALVMADGPAGLRLSQYYGVDGQGRYEIVHHEYDDLVAALPAELLKTLPLSLPSKRQGKVYEQNCTAIPVGVALAQSWDPAAVRICGDIVGDEMERFGIHLWLAPALNIHRSPLCGRNFEYYSEDPLLSGKMAAAVTRGVQAHPGCGVTIKHYCANNQETNRMHSNSQLSERALREIYLKGFEIAIAECSPAAVMTSYNLVNGEHTAHRTDLLAGVLRGEWGYDGLVMSDWVPAALAREPHTYPGACASGSICAGNDLMMPGGPEDKADLLNALHDPHARYPLTRSQLERCAARVVSTAQRLVAAHRAPDAPTPAEENIFC